MTNRIAAFVIAMLTLLFSACASDELSNESIEQLYHRHKQDLNVIVQLCYENSGFKWIGLNDVVVANAKEVQESAPARISRSRSIMTEIGAKAVSCTRDWSESDPPLVSVTVVLAAKGIAVSGSSKGIRFVPREAEHRSSRQNVVKLEQSDDGAWYIYRTD